MTWREIRKSAEEKLKAAGIDEYENDARLLIREVTGAAPHDFYAMMNDEADRAMAERLSALIERRALREPLQYITGKAPFFGRDFLVGPGVLIPRFDTEILVASVLPHLKRGMRILDLCTGSGCVLLTLLCDGPGEIEGTGADISEEALRYAVENEARLGTGARFVLSDLYDEADGVYDIITANPPYIRSGEIPSLMPEVSLFEPASALDGGDDGLDIYRRILIGASERLACGGLLAVEIGYDEERDVAALFDSNGFDAIECFRDMAGNARVVTGRKRERQEC